MKKIDIFDIDPLNITFEPLAGSTVTNLLKMLAQNNFRINPIGYPRIIYSMLMSLIFSPLNVIEHFKYNKKIINTTIKKHPICNISH